MSYTFTVEKFTSIDDNHCTIEIVEQKDGLSIYEALDLVKDFIQKHEDGYLLDSGMHLIEYETEGAEWSCGVDFMDR